MFLDPPPPAATPTATAERREALLARVRLWLDGAGASADRRVVVYGQGGAPEMTAYATVLLQAAGLGGEVSMLDGGLSGWVDAGGELTDVRSPMARAGRAIRPCDPRNIFAPLSDVVTASRTGAALIIDSRAHSFFVGTDAEDGQRPGHIPGAANVVYTSVLTRDGRFLPDSQMEALFTRAGARPGLPIIIYCHSGRKAALVYLAARRIGLSARIYDGSWSEWSLHPELPTAVGPAP